MMPQNCVSIALPDEVCQILSLLEAAGYAAYAVGGCIRDRLMGRQPNDWDIATSATPDEMKSAFAGMKYIETGLQHGTITLRLNKKSYEVTTFRVDGHYTDARHPDHVSFTHDIAEDLARRDFTVNAMAYHPQTGIVDPFGGRKDMAAGILRCVGNPAERFQEDALRILRAIRFSARLRFEIEEHTCLSIHECAHLLTKISAERIREELFGIIMAPNGSECLDKYANVIGVVIPEWLAMKNVTQNSPYHYADVLHHTTDAMRYATDDPFEVKLALFFHDMGKPDCKTTDAQGRDHFHGHPKRSAEIAHSILKRLCCDNVTINNITQLVELHDVKLSSSHKFVRRMLRNHGEDMLRLLLQVKRSDALAHRIYEDILAECAEFESALDEIAQSHPCLTMKELAINGSVLMNLGIKPGPKMGEILNQTLNEVIDGNLVNDPDVLTEYVKTCLLINKSGTE